AQRVATDPVEPGAEGAVVPHRLVEDGDRPDRQGIGAVRNDIDIVLEAGPAAALAFRQDRVDSSAGSEDPPHLVPGRVGWTGEECQGQESGKETSETCVRESRHGGPPCGWRPGAAPCPRDRTKK